MELSRNASLFNEGQLDGAGELSEKYRSLRMPKNPFVTLSNILEDESEEHQKLMHDALIYIHSEGRVPPSDLWEYQVSLLMVLAVKVK